MTSSEIHSLEKHLGNLNSVILDLFTSDTRRQTVATVATSQRIFKRKSFESAELNEIQSLSSSPASMRKKTSHVPLAENPYEIQPDGDELATSARES